MHDQSLPVMACLVWAATHSDSPEHMAELFRANEKKFSDLFSEKPQSSVHAEVVRRPF